MRTVARQVSPPLDFRFLDLFVVLVMSLTGFAVIALLLGIGGSFNYPLEIAFRSLPEATFRRVYSYELVARGGRPPYNWNGVHLPSGLVVDASGKLQGTPQALGEFPVDITVIDSRGTRSQRTLPLKVADLGHLEALRIRTPRIPVAHVETVVEFVVAVEGGILPYGWSARGLPSGTRFEDGAILGAPEQSGIFNVHIQVNDSAGESDIKEFQWQVLAEQIGSSRLTRQPLTISTVLPAAIEGTPYSVQLAASGGIPPYQWQLASAYPGMTVSSQGVLHSDEPGQWLEGSAFQIRVFDQEGSSYMATLTPSIIRNHSIWRRMMLAFAAIGGMGALFILLRRLLVPNEMRSMVDWRQPAGFVSIAMLLVSFLVFLDGGVGTLLFSFIITATAVHLVLKER